MSQDQQPSASLKRVDVVASFESQQRFEALVGLQGDFRFPGSVVSTETQQLDEVKRLDDLAAHHESIRKLLKAEKPTGTPHLFVLDPERLALGDPGERTTLQALSSAQFSARTPVAVAVLPPTSSAAQRVYGATTTLLKDGKLLEGTVALESAEQIREFLGAPVSFTVSVESANHDSLGAALQAKGVHFHPLSKEEIDHIETKMCQSIGGPLKKIYTDYGTFRTSGLTILAPNSALDATVRLVHHFREGVDHYYVPATFHPKSGQFKGVEDGAIFHVVVNLKNNKATLFNYDHPYMSVPNIPLYQLIEELAGV